MPSSTLVFSSYISFSLHNKSPHTWQWEAIYIYCLHISVGQESEESHWHWLQVTQATGCLLGIILIQRPLQEGSTLNLICLLSSLHFLMFVSLGAQILTGWWLHS